MKPVSDLTVEDRQELADRKVVFQNFGKRVGELITNFAAGSQTDFAEAINISRQIVNNICTGKNNPSLYFIQKVCRKYRKVSPTWLLLGEGRKYLSSYDRSFLDETFENLKLDEQAKVLDEELRRKHEELIVLYDKLNAQSILIERQNEIIAYQKKQLEQYTK